MSTVFERVEDEEWMRKRDKEHLLNQLRLAHQQSEASPNQSGIDHASREDRAEL
jgi:DNA replication protein DnaC